MELSPIKCVVLAVTHKVNPIRTSYTHCMVRSLIKYIKLVRRLTFNKPIKCICKRASSTLAFIRRSTHFCTRKIRADAYCTYMRPILEYVAFVWSPHTNTNIYKLESVQRSAARYVMSDFDRYSSVSEMLSTLQWDSMKLKNRRDNQSLLILYKLINGLTDVQISECMVNNYLSCYQRTQQTFPKHLYSCLACITISN